MKNVQKIWAQGEQLIDVYERFLVLEADRRSNESGGSSARLIPAKLFNEALKKRAKTAMKQAFVDAKILAVGMIGEGRERKPQHIPPEFWASANIHPEIGRAWQPGHVFDEVTVSRPPVPTTESSGGESNITQTRVIASPEAYPARAGATSYEEERELVIIKCYDKYTDFGRWTFAQKQKTLRAEAESLYPDRDWTRGFGRTAIYDTIRRLKKAGRILSDNVR